MRKYLMILLVLSHCCVPTYADTKHSKSSNAEDWSMCLCSRGANAVTSTTPKITLAQAKSLVMATLTPKGRRLPGVQIHTDDGDPNKISTFVFRFNPRFLMFHVIWDSPPDSSYSVGWYSVDIYTGDVFSSVAGCDEYHNKKLETLQNKVRQSLELTQAAYQKLKTAGPVCDPDE